MNDSETTHTHAELSDQIAALQRQTFTLLLALIVISGTLVSYLYYQSRVLGQAIEGGRQQSKPIVELYSQNQPMIQGFVDQLRVYGVTHPDFAQQILRKYQIPPPAPKK
jgi:hypothetical protein